MTKKRMNVGYLKVAKHEKKHRSSIAAAESVYDIPHANRVLEVRIQNSGEEKIGV